MVRRLLVLVICVLGLNILGGCVREKMDQSLPLPTAPDVNYEITHIAVLPFGSDSSVPDDVREKIYRAFIDYLIPHRGVFVVHPEIVYRFVDKDSPILDVEKAAMVGDKLGVNGIVIGYLSDYSENPFRITIDATLYPMVNVNNYICSGHKSYDPEDIYIIASMKQYASRFEWSKLPLGWERIKLNIDIFCDFVAWDMVKSFF